MGITSLAEAVVDTRPDTARDVLSAAREISGETAKRLDRIAQLFGVSEGARHTDGTSLDKAS